MQRLFLLIVVVATAAGALWYFGGIRLDGLEQIVANSAEQPAGDAAAKGKTTGAVPTLRIATYDVEIVGGEKVELPLLRDNLAKVIRQFDVVALQEIRSRNPNVLPQLVDAVNASGGQYDYVIGPRVGRTETTEQFAVVFNKATVEVDFNSVYTVEDPDDLISREPLVVPIRARGAEADKAFTFTLVNVRVDVDEIDEELAVLGDIVAAVRRDGRGEDDVIVLGDLQADVERLGRLWRDNNTVFCLAEHSDAYGRRTIYDNIVLRRPATSEFTGRSGAYDPVGGLGIDYETAARLSKHVPVWAEFDVTEGGRPHRVASSAGVDGASR